MLIAIFGICLWGKRLRDGALKEEELLFKLDNGKTTTLLGLINSLSRLFFLLLCFYLKIS